MFMYCITRHQRIQIDELPYQTSHLISPWLRLTRLNGGEQTLAMLLEQIACR